MAITYKRWQRAQQAESKQHNHSKEKLLSMYKDSYRQYFEYLDIEKDQKGKVIIEVGPAHVPALYFCDNFLGIIVEPMPSKILRELTCYMNARVLETPAEYLNPTGDEVWLFNVLQHVIDPELLVERMKKLSKRIRYFEPIDTEITEYHPHSLGMTDFVRWFGNPKLYEPEGKIISFHTNPCAYGVYDSV